MIIALVAIGISLMSVGLLFAVELNLQSNQKQLSVDIATQSQKLDSINSELEEIKEELKQVNEDLKEQKTKFDELNSSFTSNMTQINEELDKINQRITQLHYPHVVPRPPLESFEPKTIADEDNQKWTTHFIPDETAVCNSRFIDGCYLNISEIDTSYGKGIEVDSIGSSDYWYHFMALSDKLTSNSNTVTVSGKFLMNDDIADAQRENRSRMTVYVISADGSEIIQKQNVFTWDDNDNQWYERNVTFSLSDVEEFQIGIGRRDAWVADWNLYAAWTDVKIQT